MPCGTLRVVEAAVRGSVGALDARLYAHNDLVGNAMSRSFALDDANYPSFGPVCISFSQREESGFQIANVDSRFWIKKMIVWISFI
jgi:predicted methyltransferase MtxX (methanogen marker protein 4)